MLEVLKLTISRRQRRQCLLQQLRGTTAVITTTYLTWPVDRDHPNCYMADDHKAPMNKTTALRRNVAFAAALMNSGFPANQILKNPTPAQQKGIRRVERLVFPVESWRVRSSALSRHGKESSVLSARRSTPRLCRPRHRKHS
jgi:hypothetical protein